MKSEFFLIILIILNIFTQGCMKNPSPESGGNATVVSFSRHQLAINDYSGTVSLKTGTADRRPDLFRISARYPDNYRVDYLDSSGRHPGTIAILDKGDLLEYDPANNATIHAAVNPEGNSVTSHDYQGLLKRIIPVSDLNYSGVGSLEQQTAYIIEMRPKEHGTFFDQKYSEFRFSLARAWVEPGSFTVKKIELFDSDGMQPVVSVNYQNLSMNAGISDTVFDTGPYGNSVFIVPPTHPPMATFAGVEYPSQTPEGKPS